MSARLYIAVTSELPPGKMIPNKWVSSSAGIDNLPKLCGCSCCECIARLALQLLFWAHFQSYPSPAVQRAEGQAEEGPTWWVDPDSQGLLYVTHLSALRWWTAVTTQQRMHLKTNSEFCKSEEDNSGHSYIKKFRDTVSWEGIVVSLVCCNGTSL